jgi:hypothetical protein
LFVTVFAFLPAGRQVFLHPRQIRYQVAPGLPHLHSIKILRHDKFPAPRQFVPRHCAGAHLPTFCNRDNLPVTYQTCTTTRVMLNQLCTMTAKTRAIPSLHRDNFPAKEPGRCPVLSSGNTTSLYCRAVSGKQKRTEIEPDYHFWHQFCSIKVNPN